MLKAAKLMKKEQFPYMFACSANVCLSGAVKQSITARRFQAI
jgi:hypothetical protein